MKLKLHFGALAPLISEQIKEQLDYTDDNILHFDKDAKALARLYVRSILTEGEIFKARKRLMNAITKYLISKHLEETEKEK